MTSTTMDITYLVSDCAAHGTKETADAQSAVIYQGFARDCMEDRICDPHNHNVAHAREATDCWMCCPNMRIASPGEIAV